MENKATKRTNRLGRGLSALIPDISTEIDKKDIITIDLKIYIQIKINLEEYLMKKNKDTK